MAIFPKHPTDCSVRGNTHQHARTYTHTHTTCNAQTRTHTYTLAETRTRKEKPLLARSSLGIKKRYCVFTIFPLHGNFLSRMQNPLVRSLTRSRAFSLAHVPWQSNCVVRSKCDLLLFHLCSQHTAAAAAAAAVAVAYDGRCPRSLTLDAHHQQLLSPSFACLLALRTAAAVASCSAHTEHSALEHTSNVSNCV